MLTFSRAAVARPQMIKLATVSEGSSDYLAATVAMPMEDKKMRPLKMADLAMYLWCRLEMTLLSVLLFTINFWPEAGAFYCY